ncbi:MAG: T9SS type A sorting domain-containing protein [Chitinophagaceae bacterium]|nr:T9SS type A sorting domain-containing protein [Chitinophagaceae bacterium]
MKNLLTGLGMLLLSLNVNSQQIVKGLTAANGQYVGFLEYKPTNYASDVTTKYPLIIFLHGMGERGNGTSQIWSVAGNAIPKYIQSGHPMRFFWNGKWETFLVLSPQLSSSYFDWVDFYTEEMIKYAKTNLRIDTNRIIVTGLSLGGGGSWRYATSSLEHAQSIAAVAPVCGTCSGVTYSNIATANLPLWAFHASNDGTVGAGCTTSQVWAVEMLNPPVKPLMSIYSSGGHGIWDRSYDTTYNNHNPNIYEWFLGQNKSLAPNVLPVPNPGPNITISTSGGIANLSGIESSDIDGNIVRYIWRKVSGPAAGTIVTPVSTTGLTAITGLTTTGTYIYELKVVDERAGVAVANVTVNVTSAIVSNIPPITEAGTDISTLTSTAALNGGNSYDPDGTITSYQWTKIWGPALYNISNPTVAAPNLSFLMLGDYKFELRSTDNRGASSLDTVTIRSGASILPVSWLYFTANNNDGANKLLWSTASEINNAWFEIQRSSDAINFETIATVKGAGTSIRTNNYQYVDAVKTSAKTYYRLKQVSVDRNSSFSNIATINASRVGTIAIESYPNPVQKVLTITISSEEHGAVGITLYAVDGRIVQQKQLAKEKESVSTSIDMQQLPKGTYMLKITIGDGVQEMRKVVKQ